jgi:hypothetical protein
MASMAARGDGSTTVKENYTRWWAPYRDDMSERDMDWVRSIHSCTQSTEMWMLETGYAGIPDAGPLKEVQVSFPTWRRCSCCRGAK